jgi:hypothetical protein
MNEWCWLVSHMYELWRLGRGEQGKRCELRAPFNVRAEGEQNAIFDNSHAKNTKPNDVP